MKNYLKMNIDLNISHKGHDNPLTSVDLICQDIIFKELSNLPEKPQIVSEEGQSHYPHDYSQFLSPHLSFYDEFIDSIELKDRELDPSKLKLVLDPLDGTRSLVNYDLSRVSNLLGVLYEGKPLMGVVSAPFPKAGLNSSRIYFSHPGDGIYQITMNTTTRQIDFKRMKFTNTKPLRIITSLGNLDNIQQKRRLLSS